MPVSGAQFFGSFFPFDIYNEKNVTILNGTIPQEVSFDNKNEIGGKISIPVLANSVFLSISGS